MKLITLILPLVLIMSCTSENSEMAADSSNELIEQAEKQHLSDELIQALKKAKENQDYRLLVTSGRSMSIPGIKSEQYQELIDLCGKKYRPEAGDVITSEAQRTARKALIEFMRQYNEQILKLCQENQ